MPLIDASYEWWRLRWVGERLVSTIEACVGEKGWLALYNLKVNTLYKLTAEVEDNTVE